MSSERAPWLDPRLPNTFLPGLGARSSPQFGPKGKTHVDVSPFVGFIVLVIITILGALIRFVDLDHLAIRIDEGYTLLYQRQSWGDVLGFGGFYCPHPPLFFALAKASDIFFREEISARWVAALAGTISIPLVYVIGSHIHNRLTGLIAAALLVVAPTHVEFSRDGRMYAPVVMVVLISYIALIQIYAKPSGSWSFVYGSAISLAVYLDYSAAYALVPQGVILLMILKRHGLRAGWLFGFIVVATLSYLPWLPQVMATVERLDKSSESTSRSDSLAATWINIERSVSYLIGLSTRGSSPLDTQNVWEMWTSARPAMIVFVAIVGFGGLYAMRDSRFGLVVTSLMIFGAPVVAILASQISPGYAVRTVQIAVPGWCIAAGSFVAWFLSRSSPLHYIRATGGALLLALLVLSTLSLRATLSGADRYEWRAIAKELISPCAPDAPIIAVSSAGMFTDILNLYAGDTIADDRILTVTDGSREHWTGAERWLARGPSRTEINEGALGTYIDPSNPGDVTVWLASRLASKSLPKALKELGFVQVFERPYAGATLSLWTALTGDESEELSERCS